MNAEQNVSVLPAKPAVIIWLNVYCWILCIMYFLVMLLSILFFLIEPEELEMPALQAHITGSVMLLSGGVFFVVGLLPLICRPRPWLWIYDLIVICVGFTSCCFWPICIPLLIFWLKPEVKQYFGKSR